jgi:hypothetical protein
MSSVSRKTATLTFNPHNQNIDGVQSVVKQILGMAGCPQCGRLAVLKVDFLGDPPPDALGKQGVIGIETGGF